MSITTIGTIGAIEGNFLDKCFSKIASIALPKHMKKVIYLSSLIGMVYDEQDDKNAKSLNRQMNQLLSIAEVDDSILANRAFTRLVWGDEFITRTFDISYRRDDGCDKKDFSLVKFKTTKVDQAHLLQLARNIYKATPEWMRYDSERRMVYDVLHLFYVTREVLNLGIQGKEN